MPSRRQLHLGTEPSNVSGMRILVAGLEHKGIIWTRVATEHDATIDALRATGFEPLLEMANLEMSFARWRRTAETDNVRIRVAELRDADAVGQSCRPHVFQRSLPR